MTIHTENRGISCLKYFVLSVLQNVLTSIYGKQNIYDMHLEILCHVIKYFVMIN